MPTVQRRGRQVSTEQGVVTSSLRPTGGAGIESVGRGLAQAGAAVAQVGREFERAADARTLNNTDAEEAGHLSQFEDSLYASPDTFETWENDIQEVAKSRIEARSGELKPDVFGAWKRSYQRMALQTQNRVRDAARKRLLDVSTADLERNLLTFSEMYSKAGSDEARQQATAQAMLNISEMENAGVISDTEAGRQREQFVTQAEASRLNVDLINDPQGVIDGLDTGAYALTEEQAAKARELAEKRIKEEQTAARLEEARLKKAEDEARKARAREKNAKVYDYIDQLGAGTSTEPVSDVMKMINNDPDMSDADKRVHRKAIQAAVKPKKEDEALTAEQIDALGATNWAVRTNPEQFEITDIYNDLLPLGIPFDEVQKVADKLTSRKAAQDRTAQASYKRAKKKVDASREAGTISGDELESLNAALDEWIENPANKGKDIDEFLNPHLERAAESWWDHDVQKEQEKVDLKLRGEAIAELRAAGMPTDSANIEAAMEQLREQNVARP
jgi:hypothetical protein